jgi:hypothetical protein
MEKVASCLTENAIRNVMPDLEILADKFNPSPSNKTELKNSTCTKRTYERAGYRIVIYKDKFWSPELAQGAIHPMKSEVDAPDVCLKRTLTKVEELGNPGLNLIIKKAKVKLGERWTDPELGPVSWIKCEDKDSLEYYDSVTIMLHELTHLLIRDNCLYVPFGDRFACVSLPSSLPPIAEARVNFDTYEKTIQDHINKAQDVYMGKGREKETFLSLLDELNAYTVSLETALSFLEKKGKDTIYGPYDFRIMQYLPFVAFNIQLFLKKLKKNDPALFQRVFVADKKNQEALNFLISNSESVLNRWKAATKENDNKQDPAHYVEDGMWDLYLKEKQARG